MGTSAPIEKVFPLINNVWSDDSGIMKELTVNVMMACKIMNIGLSCEDFCNKIKNIKELLQKVLVNEKYNYQYGIDRMFAS